MASELLFTYIYFPFKKYLKNDHYRSDPCIYNLNVMVPKHKVFKRTR
jgi:hypothetical protein